MQMLYDSTFLKHETGNHPENKNRLTAFKNLQESEIFSGESYLTLVHTAEYVQRIKEACNTQTILDQDTVVGPGSFEAAVQAVGATIAASQSLDFALVRPPGHHAHVNKAAGFCIFNNIAIATQKLVMEGKKVLIFDFDGHLGDGTEDFFYGTHRVLYWSLHQAPAFPGGGSIDKIGEGEGTGFTINVPLPMGTNDEMYLTAVNTLLPIAQQFEPDFVAVSAGFDGHQSDPLLQLKLSSQLYWKLGALLTKHFKNIFAVLEGGYNTDTLPTLVSHFIDGINGNPRANTQEESPEPLFLMIEEFDTQLKMLTHLLRPYWKLP